LRHKTVIIRTSKYPLSGGRN